MNKYNYHYGMYHVKGKFDLRVTDLPEDYTEEETIEVIQELDFDYLLSDEYPFNQYLGLYSVGLTNTVSIYDQSKKNMFIFSGVSVNSKLNTNPLNIIKTSNVSSNPEPYKKTNIVYFPAEPPKYTPIVVTQQPKSVSENLSPPPVPSNRVIKAELPKFDVKLQTHSEYDSTYKVTISGALSYHTNNIKISHDTKRIENKYIYNNINNTVNNYSLPYEQVNNNPNHNRFEVNSQFKEIIFTEEYNNIDLNLLDTQDAIIKNYKDEIVNGTSVEGQYYRYIQDTLNVSNSGLTEYNAYWYNINPIYNITQQTYQALRLQTPRLLYPYKDVTNVYEFVSEKVPALYPLHDKYNNTINPFHVWLLYNKVDVDKFKLEQSPYIKDYMYNTLIETLTQRLQEQGLEYDHISNTMIEIDNPITVPYNKIVNTHRLIVGE